jgi:hypothetical protein
LTAGARGGILPGKQEPPMRAGLVPSALTLTAQALSLAAALGGALAGCSGQDPLLVDPYEDPPADPAPPDHGAWLSMALAPDQSRLVMAYYDRELGALGFAVGTPQDDGTVAWAHEQVDGYSDPNSGTDTGDRGKFASMKVAPDGTVWIAYYDATKRDLRYAHRAGGLRSWSTGLVDNGTGGLPSAGEWCSLALDANGSPVISYQDGTDKTLKVARLSTTQDEGTPELEWTVSEAWRGQAFSQDVTAADGTVSTVTREANVGQFSRLLISGATEYIAYYDAAQQRLGLLEGSNGSYTQSFITEAGTDQGAWPSLLLDGGTLWAAWHDLTNQNLMVGSRGNGGWTSEVADPGEYVGADTEIFKRGGDVAVVYFDGQNNDMKAATKSGASWNIETLGSEGAVGFHNEVVRVGDGFWAGSYNYTSRTTVMVQLQ